MDSCGCDDQFSIFDRKTAASDRDRYRDNGPDRTTKMLLDMIRPTMWTGAAVLDIGGGIGVIDHELLGAGAGHAVLVDASSAYLHEARNEARERNLLDRLEFVEGDFVHRAPDVDAADIVTLDRVVCCYPDMERLVGLSAARARKVYGLVLPRDGLLIRLGLAVINLGFRIRRRSYRSYGHSNSTVDDLVAAHGLRPIAEQTTWFWRVVAYERIGMADSDPAM